jgi:tellurite resistance protein TerC
LNPQGTMHAQLSTGSPTLWIGFTAFVILLLVIDLGIFHKEGRAVSTKEALWWTVVWISLALLFNLGIYYWFGQQPALEFLAGYLIEKALSVDNLFVFMVVFSYFGVPVTVQHRILFWGIFGALVMRAVFIGVGAALLHSFHWTTYLFGIFLVALGVRLFFQADEEAHPERNPLVKLIERYAPFTSELHGDAFTVRKNGKFFFTPLFLVLITIEATDVVFAVDSIPAIFAVTSDPFLVYTSNIFAILGLRALFFVIASLLDKFTYLQYGLALVLSFVGTKMLIADWYEIPIVYSLLTIISLLGGAIVASILLQPTRPALPYNPETEGEPVIIGADPELFSEFESEESTNNSEQSL